MHPAAGCWLLVAGCWLCFFCSTLFDSTPSYLEKCEDYLNHLSNDPLLLGSETDPAIDKCLEEKEKNSTKYRKR